MRQRPHKKRPPKGINTIWRDSIIKEVLVIRQRQKKKKWPLKGISTVQIENNVNEVPVGKTGTDKKMNHWGQTNFSGLTDHSQEFLVRQTDWPKDKNVPLRTDKLIWIDRPFARVPSETDRPTKRQKCTTEDRQTYLDWQSTCKSSQWDRQTNQKTEMYHWGQTNLSGLTEHLQDFPVRDRQTDWQTDKNDLLRASALFGLMV